jgi:S-adenosylmethionine-diacylglycerol 3-amino-3-carboxypropyl transferase
MIRAAEKDHRPRRRLLNATRDRIFNNIHSNNLVYNACWEDPRIDRELLAIDGDSRIVMLTSAGCNALDYLLDGPAAIHAIDVNARQNALLQLKLCLFEHGNWADLFAMFGTGAHPHARQLYKKQVRWALPREAQRFWDEKITYFDGHGLKKSFYYRGSAGAFAWAMRQVLNAKGSFRANVNAFLNATSLEEQSERYAYIEPHLWSGMVSWLLKRHAVLAMLGVPRPQRQLIDEQHPDSLPGFLRDSLRRVATEMSIADNYFWRVYITGAYTRACCPNYLRAESFTTLAQYARRVSTHTMTLASFLQQHPGRYSHFVLLDHQDWLAWFQPAALHEEWQLILRNSRPGTKILFRSAANDADFLPPFVREALRFFPERTAPLHQRDRVGTYASLHFAEVL